jgi:hypothetical protein
MPSMMRVIVQPNQSKQNLTNYQKQVLEAGFVLGFDSIS